MDVRLAGDGQTLLVENRVGRAGHDAELALESVPALNGAGGAVVLLHQALHGHGESGDGIELPVGHADVHVLANEREGLVDGGILTVLLGDGCAGGGCELGERHGDALDVEALEQLALVAHGGVELVRARADLQDAGAPERLDHVADRDEVTQPALEDGVGETAVGEVGEGDAEATQHLAGGKETALGVAQPGAVRLGTLVKRAPKQHRHAKVLCQARAEELRAEVTMRQEEAIHVRGAELLQDFEAVLLAVEEPLLVDVVDVDELDAHLP